jgi:hypothetical protein
MNWDELGARKNSSGSAIILAGDMGIHVPPRIHVEIKSRPHMDSGRSVD